MTEQDISFNKNRRLRILKRISDIVSKTAYVGSDINSVVSDWGEAEGPIDSFASCSLYVKQPENTLFISFHPYQSARKSYASLSHIFLFYLDCYNSLPALASASVTLRTPHHQLLPLHLLSMSPRCLNAKGETS